MPHTRHRLLNSKLLLYDRYGHQSVVAEAAVNFGECFGYRPKASSQRLKAKSTATHSCGWTLEQLLADLKAKCDLSKVIAISGAGQQHGSVYVIGGQIAQ